MARESAQGKVKSNFKRPAFQKHSVISAKLAGGSIFCSRTIICLLPPPA